MIKIHEPHHKTMPAKRLAKNVMANTDQTHY